MLCLIQLREEVNFPCECPRHKLLLSFIVLHSTNIKAQTCTTYSTQVDPITPNILEQKTKTPNTYHTTKLLWIWKTEQHITNGPGACLLRERESVRDLIKSRRNGNYCVPRKFLENGQYLKG